MKKPAVRATVLMLAAGLGVSAAGAKQATSAADTTSATDTGTTSTGTTSTGTTSTGTTGTGTTSAGTSGTTDTGTTADPSQVPIKLRVDKSEKRLIYSIPVRYGSDAIEAVLDSGSIPTLVLPGRVPPRDAQSTGGTYSVTYGGDRTYVSDIVQGTIKIGKASGTIAFGVVTSVHCVPTQPSCPVAGEEPRNARFAGIHAAIVGARMASGAGTLKTAFNELGVHSFIIEAPRQGEGNGSLHLDPNTNETSRFVPIFRFEKTDGVPLGSVRGCLRDQTNGASFCGAVVFDSAVTGITVVPASGGAQTASWAAKDAGQLEFVDPSGAEIAGVDFPVDADEPTTVTLSAPGQAAQAVIYVGQLPYIGFAVLTDLENHKYAVKLRAKARDGIVAHVP